MYENSNKQTLGRKLVESYNIHTVVLGIVRHKIYMYNIIADTSGKHHIHFIFTFSFLFQFLFRTEKGAGKI